MSALRFKTKATLLFWGGGQRQSKLCAVFPRREPARTLTLLPPFTFFEKRGFQKKSCGEILAVLESIIIPCEALCHCERSVAISRKGHRILGKV